MMKNIDGKWYEGAPENVLGTCNGCVFLDACDCGVCPHVETNKCVEHKVIWKACNPPAESKKITITMSVTVGERVLNFTASELRDLYQTLQEYYNEDSSSL